jgi:hypothetical protein
MSKLNTQLRALGSIYLDDDGTGEPWLEVEGGFRYIAFAMSGPVAVGRTLSRAQIESDCGRLVPMTD